MENEPYRLLKEAVQEISKRTEEQLKEFRKEFSDIKKTAEDTNRETHTTKHDVTEIRGNWQRFIDILEKRDERDEEIRKTVTQMHEDVLLSIQERKNHAEWIKNMQGLGTVEGYKELFAEVKRSREFRTRFGSIGWVLGGIGTFVAVVYALKDLLGLFFDFLNSFL